MIYLITFALVLLAVWLAYRVGVADGRREVPAIVRNDYSVNIDIGVIKAAIERYGLIVLEPQTQKNQTKLRTEMINPSWYLSRE